MTKPIAAGDKRRNPSQVFVKYAVMTILLGCLVLFTAFGIPKVLWYTVLLFNDPFNDLTFNQARWQQFDQSMEPDNPRGRMAESAKAVLLKGKFRRDQVVKLLGSPDYDDGSPDYDERENLLSYNLGMWSNYRMDYDSFDVHFDETGRVSKIYFMQH